MNASDKYVLVVEGRKVNLTHGMVVGRGADCDITLQRTDEASRRHARFLVLPNGVFIEDLESTNGTYVGTQRIGKQAVRVGPEDIIRIGGCLMRAIPEVDVERESWLEATPAYGLRIAPAENDAQTRPADIFDVLHRVASRAIADGLPEEAERITSAHLNKYLDEARLGRADRQQTNTVVTIALGLAKASGKSKWYNYLVLVHDALQLPMNPETAEAFALASHHSGEIDLTNLQSYWRRISSRMESLSGQERVAAERLQSLLLA